MAGFEKLPRDQMTWIQNVLGAEVTRLYTNGAVLTVVRGKAGDIIPPHGYTHGSVTYVVEGELDIDGEKLVVGDAGRYQPGSGYYAVKFLTDGAYVVARTAEDQLTVPDIGERAAGNLDAG
jgi:hypothetical protein